MCSSDLYLLFPLLSSSSPFSPSFHCFFPFFHIVLWVCRCMWVHLGFMSDSSLLEAPGACVRGMHCDALPLVIRARERRSGPLLTKLQLRSVLFSHTHMLWDVYSVPKNVETVTVGRHPILVHTHTLLNPSTTLRPLCSYIIGRLGK